MLPVDVDKDGDGEPDINIDKDGDDEPDLNIDTDGDGEPDLNIDRDGDGEIDKIDPPKDDNKNPATGDSSQLPLWILMFVGAILSCSVVFGFARRKSSYRR